MGRISVGYWLERAGVVSEIAHTMSDPATRHLMLEAENNYRLLADQALHQTDSDSRATKLA